MAKVDRVVGYAGVSVVSDEDGKVTHNFHTSCNKKYAVWAMLPETVLATGKSVTFFWFKMPANTTKTAAVRTLLEGKFWGPTADIKNMLQAILDKSLPKPKKEKAVKQPKAKKAKVTVTVKSPEEQAKTKSETLAMIKKLAEKRNAA
jgi:hypothetical protein